MRLSLAAELFGDHMQDIFASYALSGGFRSGACRLLEGERNKEAISTRQGLPQISNLSIPALAFRKLGSGKINKMRLLISIKVRDIEIPDTSVGEYPKLQDRRSWVREGL